MFFIKINQMERVRCFLNLLQLFIKRYTVVAFYSSPKIYCFKNKLIQRTMNPNLPSLHELQLVAQQHPTDQKTAITRWINTDFSMNQIQMFSIVIGQMKDSYLKRLLTKYIQQEEVFRFSQNKVTARNMQNKIKNMSNYPRGGNNIPSKQQLQKISNGNEAIKREFIADFIQVKWSLSEYKMITVRLKSLKESQFQKQMLLYIKEQELYYVTQGTKMRHLELDQKKLCLEEKKFGLEEKKFGLEQKKYSSDIKFKERAEKTQYFKILVSFAGIFFIFLMAASVLNITIGSMKNPTNYPVPSGGSLVKADTTTQQTQQNSKTVGGILWAVCIIFFIIGCIALGKIGGYECYVYQWKICCCFECCCEKSKEWYIPLPWLRKKNNDVI